MGCATKTYTGPAVENPWNTRNFGTTTIPDTIEPSPDLTEPEGSGDDFLDQLRFFRDYQPLYRVLQDNKIKSEDEQKKSDAGTSPFQLTTTFDIDSADQVDYNSFIGNSDDDFDVSWSVNTDPGSNYLADLDLGTDFFLNTDPGPGITLDANLDFGTDLFASSDSGSNDYDFFNFDDLFSKKRTRRSARDFLRREKA